MGNLEQRGWSSVFQRLFSPSLALSTSIAIGTTQGCGCWEVALVGASGGGTELNLGRDGQRWTWERRPGHKGGGLCQCLSEGLVRPRGRCCQRATPLSAESQARPVSLSCFFLGTCLLVCHSEDETRPQKYSASAPPEGEPESCPLLMKMHVQ